MTIKKKRKLSPAEKREKQIRILQKKARRAEADGNFLEYAQIKLLLNNLEDSYDDLDEEDVE